MANRCQSIQLVLDGVEDIGNVNACLRTAEGFGLLNVHVVGQQAESSRLNRSDAGAGKWLKVKFWSNSADCLAELYRLGCRLVGLSLEPGSQPIGDIDFTDGLVALVLGHENRGLSPEFVAASESVHLPMVGLVQSYNVSVAAALAIQTAFGQRWPNHADLSPAQQQQLLTDYSQGPVEDYRI